MSLLLQNRVRSPSPTDDDEPSNLISIPDVRRASAIKMQQKKINGRNVSQSDTKMLNALWSEINSPATDDLKQPQINEAGIVYIQDGIYLSIIHYILFSYIVSVCFESENNLF